MNMGNDFFSKALDKKITRRQFIGYSLLGLSGLALGAYGCNPANNKSSVFKGDAPDELWKYSKEAYHYNNVTEGVQCSLCPHGCILAENDRGSPATTTEELLHYC